MPFYSFLLLQIKTDIYIYFISSKKARGTWSIFLKRKLEKFSVASNKYLDELFGLLPNELFPSIKLFWCLETIPQIQYLQCQMRCIFEGWKLSPTSSTYNDTWGIATVDGDTADHQFLDGGCQGIEVRGAFIMGSCKTVIN